MKTNIVGNTLLQKQNGLKCHICPGLPSKVSQQASSCIHNDNTSRFCQHNRQDKYQNLNTRKS